MYIINIRIHLHIPIFSTYDHGASLLFIFYYFTISNFNVHFIFKGIHF